MFSGQCPYCRRLRRQEPECPGCGYAGAERIHTAAGYAEEELELLKEGLITIDEARKRQGLDPLPQNPYAPT